MISVLITNYNKSKFLKKTLKSVILNRHKNYEIILFDDASTDSSLKVLKQFKNIKLIRNKKKIYKSPALNQINGILECFKISKGNLICLLDGDDCFTKKKLKLIEKNLNNRNIDCIFNLPKERKKRFYPRIKDKCHSIWPTIIPTSCISFKRNFFIKFLKLLEKKKYKNLEIDARLTIFSKFYLDQFNIIPNKLTFYGFDIHGITSSIKKFSIKWWIRRYEAFQYLRFILKMRKKPFKASIDYYLTCFIFFACKNFQTK
jgi:glycosyltransferase involved in cell wall biosynthesis